MTQDAAQKEELENTKSRGQSRKGSNIYTGNVGGVNNIGGEKLPNPSEKNLAKKDDSIIQDEITPESTKPYPTSFADFVLLILVGS